MLWTIWGTVFIAFFLITYGVAVSWSKRQRVKMRAGSPGPMAVAPLLVHQQEISSFKEWLIDWLSFSGEWALPSMDKVSEMRKALVQAGFRHAKAPAVYMGLRVVAAFSLPLPLLFYFIFRGKITPLTILLAFCLTIVGFFLPSYILGVRVGRRQERLDKALPDIMDLFVICMGAGLSLNSTLHRVAEEIRGVYNDFFQELQIAAAELRTGIPWDEAFDNLGQRTGVQSIRSMVALVIQSDKLGDSVGEALRNHSDFVRTQRVLRAEEKAAKLPVKMIFPLIFCIFPAILVVVVGPGLIHIFDKFIKGNIQGIFTP